MVLPLHYIGVPEQALGCMASHRTGFGMVIEDIPTEFSCTCTCTCRSENYKFAREETQANDQKKR